MTIRTWANGSGLWRASVPRGDHPFSPETMARRAIRNELRARGDISPGSRYPIPLRIVHESETEVTYGER